MCGVRAQQSPRRLRQSQHEADSRCHRQSVEADAAMSGATRLAEVEAIVNEQAEDAGLWFVPANAAEAYLQQELRRLHAAIEGKTPEECARAILTRTDSQP